MSNTSFRWAFNLNDWTPNETDLLVATSCIQPEEKVRIQKFVFQNDYKASLIGRLLMRKFVSLTTEIPYNEIKFSRDGKGKPILVNEVQEKLAFNVAHQGSYTVFAGEVGRERIGVDVMKMEYTGGKKLDEFFRIMNKNFSEDEWKRIRGGRSEDEFFRHWCLKESYVKAIGVGITVNLKDISFKVCSDLGEVVDDTELYFKGQKVDWSFHESVLRDKHVVAVAVDNKEGKCDFKKFEELNIKDVLEGAIGVVSPDVEFTKNFFSKLQRQ